ncbi:efflux RND transporter periplasmic adaptor subunit [Pseudomonas sp. TH31]|nr:efflux RND transporter periplasmic adaptor subunit [Pseudomonas sp. TH31]
MLASGILQPVRKVDVGSQASGQLKSLLVHPGDFVNKGQLLGEIDPALSVNALQDAQVALNSLLAQKMANDAQVNQSRLALQRQREMFAQQAAARQDVESAEVAMQVQLAQLASMKAQIHQQKIRVDTAKTNLGYTRILAPVSGTVVSVTTQEGQTVVASYQVPVILQIADLSTMTVRAQIPEADIARLRIGMQVCFTTLGIASQPHCSTLNVLEPAPEKINNAQFFNALFNVANTDGALRPDMTAQVTVVLKRAENVLAIPVTALGTALPDHRYQVQVLTPEGQSTTRTVLTGLDNTLLVEVKEGLQLGDTVVLASEDTAQAAP